MDLFGPIWVIRFFVKTKHGVERWRRAPTGIWGGAAAHALQRETIRRRETSSRCYDATSAGAPRNKRVVFMLFHLTSVIFASFPLVSDNSEKIVGRRVPNCGLRNGGPGLFVRRSSSRHAQITNLRHSRVPLCATGAGARMRALFFGIQGISRYFKVRFCIFSGVGDGPG